MASLRTVLTNIYYGSPLYDDERLLYSAVGSLLWTHYRRPGIITGSEEPSMGAFAEAIGAFLLTPMVVGFSSIVIVSILEVF